MSDKQVYELTIDDLADFGVWFFPMDDTVEDELTVRPLAEQETCSDFQIIVRANFFGVSGSVYSGYLYWGSDCLVEYLKPVILSQAGETISFWNGIVQPTWDSSEFSNLLRSDLPISYVSAPLLNLPSVRGRLEGLYYLAGDRVCCVS